MSPRAIADGLVAELRKVPVGGKPHMGEIRRAIGCSQAELGWAVQALRMQGKLAWDRLELRPSMRSEEQDPAAAGDHPAGAGGSGQAPETSGASGEDARPPCDVQHEGGPGEAAPPSDSFHRAPDEADGWALLAEIESYCALTGTPEGKIGGLLYRHPGFVGLLRLRGLVAPDKAEAIRRLMASNPDGLAHVEAPNPRMKRPQPDPPAAARADLGNGARPTGLSGPVTGAQIFAEVSGYLARTGMSKARFGQLAANSPMLVDRLGNTKRPRRGTIEKVRAFMSRDVPPPTHGGGSGGRHLIGGSRHADARMIEQAGRGGESSVRERVEAEAAASGARRRLAQSTGTVSHILDLNPGLVERIQTELADSPSDLIKAVTRKHPVLWRRAVLLGRATGMSPAGALYRAIEAGLDALERTQTEDAA